MFDHFFGLTIEAFSMDFGKKISRNYFKSKNFQGVPI